LYRPPDLLGLDVGKDVEQVADVETDVQRLVAVVDVDFFLRFFLFGVGRCNFKLVVRKLDAHALELVGGKDGGALQAALQDFAIDLEMPRVIGGYDPGEVGELALDQLGDEFDVAEAETDLARGHVDADRLVAFGQQTLHFKYRLTRHDDVVLVLDALDRGAAMGKAVAVGGHGAHPARLEHEQQAVQIIADVLLRHGEMHHVEQVLERLLQQRKRDIPFLGLGQGGKFVGSQRLQGKAAFARLNRELARGKRQLDLAGVGQGTQDVEQLARRDRGGFIGVAHAKLRVRRNLYFEVGGDKGNFLALLAQQDIGQNRQRISSFDYSRHRGQRFQQGVAS